MENILGFWKEFGPQIFYGIPLGQYNQLIAVDYKPYFELSSDELKFYGTPWLHLVERNLLTSMNQSP
jgi:hypothetical protein